MASAAAMAAALFIANNQPWGFVAPPALSGVNISKGNVIAYTPWFEVGTFRGDLLALPVASSGVVNVLAPLWRASPTLDLQDFSTGRRIVTTDGAGAGISFDYPVLTATQQSQVGSKTIVDYVRGDRSNESTTGLRPRSSVLGDIIHSNPSYVGKAVSGYTFDNYLAFASANAARSPRVFVGANDGMLHAFDASNGNEVYAYVPSMVVGNLSKLTVQPYKHQYFVDGFLTTEDAQIGGSWRTVLVGGLGAGGRGFYGLDVTDPDAATEADAAGKILWEFHSGSAGAGNLGFSYSRPSVVRLNSGGWGAVVGNGYLSSTGAASLYILDIATGALIQEIIVSDLSANGLSSPTLIDTSTPADGIVDVAYAGDLNGNLWKFDLSSSSSASWSVAFVGQPLFQTALVGGVRQPITTAPEVGRHPDGGAMVYIGTGRLLGTADGLDKTTQAVYGIWDDGGSVPIDITDLVQQQLISRVHISGVATRVATANILDWSTNRGWMTPTEISGATTLDQGERVIQDVQLRDGRVSFMTVNPTIATGDNWFIQLDAFTGGAPRKTIIDVNGDFVLDVADNVDSNADGFVNDIPEDRVVGQYQNFGLASRPVVGVLTSGTDVALINHLVAIAPGVAGDPADPGLKGGHFDLDTSHLIYPFNTAPPSGTESTVPTGSGGNTDGHVHQWDDKHNLTTIDYFSLPDGSGNPLFEATNSINGVQPSEEFVLTIANNDLSPGGVLEINGASISVGDYRALLDRYLSGTLLPGETFPLYKMSPPTAAQALAGVTQLFGLKMSFDAFAIIAGDLIPTVTGCVRNNTPGALGEYRNGALLLQALDASDVSGGFVLDLPTRRYVAGSTALHSSLGYATDGLLWESTVFWHWEGPCYGDPTWAPLYDSCVTQGLGGCTKSSDDDKKKGKKKKKKKKKKDDDDDGGGSPPPSAVPPTESDSGNTVTNTTVGGNNDVGRLFWQELIPEE